VDVDRTIRRIESGSADLTIERTAELAAAKNLLTSGEFDFIISNWGFQSDTAPVAVQLLDLIHDARVRVPLIVFGEPGSHEASNRAEAIEAGAFAFETQYDGLFRRMHEIASSLKQGRDS
jgi:hypothetical protein